MRVSDALQDWSPRRARRWCRRNGHPVSLAVTLWDGGLLEVCHCAQRDGMVRRYNVTTTTTTTANS